MMTRVGVALVAALLVIADGIAPVALAQDDERGGRAERRAERQQRRDERREERQERRHERHEDRGQRPDRDERRDGCAALPQPRERHRGDAKADIWFLGVGADRQRRARDHFDVTEVRGIIIAVDWKNIPEGSTQRLEVYTPGGDLYKAYVSPVAEGAPVESVLPLQGWVTNFALFGGWCAEVFLVGEEEPIARSRFVLKKR
jgi:hypothetical protein